MTEEASPGGRSAGFLATHDWHLEIARIIARLDQPDFADALVKALSRVAAFDHSVIFAYRGEERPLALYDNFSAEQREVFVSQYQAGPYLLDPFYHAGRDRIASGLYRMRNLAPDRFFQSEYYASYYRRTGLAEEIGFFLALPGEVMLVISLMRVGKRSAFTEREMARLRIVEPLVRESAGHHWRGLCETFGAPPKRDAAEEARPEPAPAETANATLLHSIVQGAFQTFGRSVLTPRECEVVGLVLRGHSSDSISCRLGIASGTVRIHRRNIYAKLGIGSQSELFSLFIKQLPEAAGRSAGP